MIKMIIRKAVKEDAQTLDYLLTLLIQDEQKYDDNIDENFTVQHFYENYIDDFHKYIIVAEEENKIIGYLYGYQKKDESLHNKVAVLDALYVEEKYRKKGVASSFISSFKTWCLENSIQEIEVNVLSQNLKAKNLYSKHNFVTKKETMYTNII